MNWRQIAVVYRKELREMLRDKRALRSMILIPTLVMPGLAIGVGLLAANVVSSARSDVAAAAVLGGADSPAVVAALRALPRIRVVPAPPDWRAQIAEKKLRAVVEIPPGFAGRLAEGEGEPVRIYYYEGELKSGLAAGELEDFFSDLRRRTVDERLQRRGLARGMIEPFRTEKSNVAPPEKVGGNAFGGLVPYFIIVLCFTGAMYPAMDLTAGEKERGTMETLLSSPVDRVDLVLGKFGTVLTSSLAAMAFSALSLTASFLGTAALWGAGGRLPGGSGRVLDPLGILGVAALTVPVAVLFSALLFSVSLCAKSFKEAQSYVAPLLLVVIVPAVIGLLPGIELTDRLAFVPILNLSLACRELLSGVWHWHYLALIFLSTAGYATLALAGAVRLFQREDVIFRA